MTKKNSSHLQRNQEEEDNLVPLKKTSWRIDIDREGDTVEQVADPDLQVISGLRLSQRVLEYYAVRL